MNEDGTWQGWADRILFQDRTFLAVGFLFFWGGLRVSKSAANPLLDPTCITGLQMDFGSSNV